VTRLQLLTSPVAASLSPLATLTYAEPQQLHLRDGEVVIYRRGDSPLWQCRFKLADGTWHRVSTKRASIEAAVAAATDLYDQARYRQRLGLAHRAQNFAQIAAATLHELRAQIDSGVGKTAYHSYVSCIERYFLPYFADYQLEAITHSDIVEFELWRNRQMAKTPKASTLNNFASAWNRLCQTAINRGWISREAAIPKLSTRGQKSVPRPAFDRDEVDQLLAFMAGWSKEGRLAMEREIRPLLRDYVEILLYTGMRHGTEAMGLCWNHVSWYTHEGKKYLRLWVSGKTGGRWLIAKHEARAALERLQQRQSKLKLITFDELLSSRVKDPVFVTVSGYQPQRIDGTFRRLLRDSGLEIGETRQRRTLYSLRHTYATLELLNNIGIHTLSKQMGNSAAMIERHYSKLAATMAADRLA
jgi:integrase